jgi:hypothetical protein
MITRISAILFAFALYLSLAVADESAKKPQAKNDQLQAIRALEGTWIQVKPAPPEGQKPPTLVFRPTAGGSAVMETMSPGSDHEMLNVYTEDEKGVMLTHYCLMGNQPRMRLTSARDGVMKFEYIDAGNLKSRDEAHMDSLVITVKGDQMTQDWAMYADGKVTGHHTFELIKQ